MNVLSHAALFVTLSVGAVAQQVPTDRAQALADYAVDAYGQDALKALGDLVAFDTFHRDGVQNRDHVAFKRMTAYVERLAQRFGLDFADHGDVIVVGLGDSSERLGVVTHGDVQPADPAKWSASPFELDTTSEPGRLVGRGVEDDKGPIACALYAMRAIKEQGLPLSRRIELIISYTEESDWAPFRNFLAENPPPQLNVAFDAEYPVVIAEKGWCSARIDLPLHAVELSAGPPALVRFSGGFFLSQVPEDAEATILHPTPEVEARLLAAARADLDMAYSFHPSGDALTIRALGKSAHSSKPAEGVNAITHLAELLSVHDWPANGQAWMVRFIHDLVGTGHLGERFGGLAYADEFMGPLTVSFGTLEEEGARLIGGINLRRPVGRTEDEVRASLDAAIADWIAASGCDDLGYSASIGAPHPPVDAPHVPVLMQTFQHYTGQAHAEPISIGGGTHARMVPHGVNFGPAMPGVPYTGHSEHEFMTREQFLLNLRMYTSLLADLAGP